MAVQKRQRLETAERFRKHLDVVRERLEACLRALPDEENLDSKLLIKTESMEISEDVAVVGQGALLQVKVEPGESGDDDESIPSLQDKMMCDIIEGL